MTTVVGFLAFATTLASFSTAGVLFVRSKAKDWTAWAIMALATAMFWALALVSMSIKH